MIAGEIWKGDILIADIKELEKLDASEIYPRRLNAKEVVISQKDKEKLYFLWQMVQQNYQEGTTNSKNPLWDGNPPKGERISAEYLTAIGKSFDLQKQKMTQELTRTFGPLKVISFIVIILNREFNYMCRKKSHFRFH